MTRSPGTGGPGPLAGSLMVGASVVAATTVVARVVGVGRWFAFSHGVGATCTGQIYQTANQVPNLLFEIAAGGALAAVAVPVVAAHLNRGRRAEADQAASALLTWAIGIGLPLSIAVAVLARPIMRVLLPGGDCGGDLATGVTMLLIFAPQVLLYAVGIVLAGVLQAHHRFFAAALAPLLSSLVVIATYLAYGWWVPDDTSLGDTPTAAILVLAGGTTAGVLALSLPLFLPARRAGIRWRPTWQFPAGTGRRAGALAAAGLIAVGAQQLCLLATVWLSNRAEAVAVLNVYTYSQTIYLLPYAVLVVPLATVAFPRFTDPDQAHRVLSRTSRAVGVVAVVACGVLLAVRHDVGALFLAIDAGAAGAGRASLELIPVALAAYAFGLVGFSMMALLTRALYAQGSARGAAAATAAGWLVAGGGPLLVLVIAGERTPGGTLIWLGLFSSAGMTIAALGLATLVRRSWGRGVLAGVARPMLVVAAAAVLVVGLREWVQAWLEPLGVPAALLAAVTTVLVLLLGCAAALRWGAASTWDEVATRLRRTGTSTEPEMR